MVDCRLFSFTHACRLQSRLPTDEQQNYKLSIGLPLRRSPLLQPVFPAVNYLSPLAEQIKTQNRIQFSQLPAVEMTKAGQPEYWLL